MTSTTARHPTFLELVQGFENRPIRNLRDLRKAYRMIDGLMSKPGLTKDERDYLEVLSILVERYEAKVAPLEETSHSAMLAHLMEARSASQAQVSRGTGISPATLSNVRAGRREFSKADIRKLCEFFRVAPGAWL